MALLRFFIKGARIEIDHIQLAAAVFRRSSADGLRGRAGCNAGA